VFGWFGFDFKFGKAILKWIDIKNNLALPNWFKNVVLNLKSG